MAFYDPHTGILHGKKLPQIYSDNVSVGQVILNVLYRTPDKVSQVCDDDGIELTCSQMSVYMTNIAKNLSKLGYESGDVAGLIARNSTYVAPTIFACFLLRLPINPLDTSFNVNKIVQIYRETVPKVIFCDHSNADKLIAALAILESEARVVILTEAIEGLSHISDFLNPCNDVRDDFIYRKDDNVVKCAMIVCTSGSSGVPKPAKVSHRQQLQAYTWINEFNRDIFTFNTTAPYWLTHFNSLIFHTLSAQTRLITSKPFTTDLFFDIVEKYRPSSVFVLPPYLVLLSESPRFESADWSFIKDFITGGLYVSVGLRNKIQEKLTDGCVKVGYGMTEFGGLIAETDTSLPHSTSVGKPTVNTEVKILIDDGTIGGIREIGEILVRNQATKFLGYFNSIPSTILDDDGWLHTSDMGFIDESSEINIIGQRTFIIKNIYNEIFPCEIEGVVEAIPGVKFVCVVGTPDPAEVEVATALVVRDGINHVNEEIIVEATSNLPTFKQLRGGVFFVDALPTNGSGKIQRKEAKEIATKLKIERLSRS